MSTFTALQLEDLQNNLRCGLVHDAKIETLRYDRECKKLMIVAFNSAFNTKIKLICKDVKFLQFINTGEFSNSETILSLTVEKDYLQLLEGVFKCKDCFKNSLCLLIQMFSGDEIHIVSEEVCLEYD